MNSLLGISSSLYSLFFKVLSCEWLCVSSTWVVEVGGPDPFINLGIVAFLTADSVLKPP